jgi:coniferyl-aldehyde dehydrogenase
MEQSLKSPGQNALEDAFHRLFELSRTTPAPSLDERLDRLARLRAAVADNEGRLKQAISADFGHRSATETTIAETMMVFAEIRHAAKHLKKWRAPRRVSTALQFVPAKNRLMPQPVGVVGIIAPWNYPLQLTLAPAVAALAAGNRVMIKPSELVPRFSALLREVISAKFDATEMMVTGIDDDIARAFAALPFDHLMFTGSIRVGRLVAEAAGRNLTPVTLELGGKSPAIVDRSADLAERRSASPTANCSMPARPASRPIMHWCRKAWCRISPAGCRPVCGPCTAPIPTTRITPRSSPTGIMRGSKAWWPPPPPRAPGSCR